MPHRQIAADFIARQTTAIFENDLEAYMDTVSLPYRRLSLTHDALVETEAQVRNNLNNASENVAAHTVNLLFRQPRSVRKLSERYIEIIYTSHHLKDATHMVQPYEGRGVITLIDDKWRMIESEQQLKMGWNAELQTSFVEQYAPLEHAADDIRTTGIRPKETYQEHLDAIARSELEDDFEQYVSYLQFPHTAHSQSMDKVLERPEDVRPFFEMIKRTWNGDVGDRLSRTCNQAEFIGSDLLVGYHTGRAYRNGAEIIEPVHSRMILQWFGDRWKLLSVANSIVNKEYPFDMYTPGDKLMTDLDIQRRTMEWPSFLRKRTLKA